MIDAKLLPNGWIVLYIGERVVEFTIEEADRASYLLGSCVQESKISGEDDSDADN